MTTLTENKKIAHFPDPTYYKQPVASGAIEFFKGGICNFNTAGFVKLGTDTASENFAGIARDELDQATGGSNGDNSLELLMAGSGNLVILDITGVVQADINKDVFVVDTGSVALVGVTSNDVRVGKIFALSVNANEAIILLN